MDLYQENPLQAARSCWRAKKQAAEEEEKGEVDEVGSKKDDVVGREKDEVGRMTEEKDEVGRDITAWQKTLPPPPHPLEGSYLQVRSKCYVVWTGADNYGWATKDAHNSSGIQKIKQSRLLQLLPIR